MPGKVHCFNLYSEPLRLQVNGVAAGTIPGWDSSGSGQYRPFGLAVARTKHAGGGPAAFANDGDVSLRMAWDDFTATGSVRIGGQPNISLDDDLILQIAVNQMSLLNTRGFVLLTAQCRVSHD
jgi:hypothetical protein